MTTTAGPSRERGIFCNRTLNLRAIKAIGYDMDYTLVHYRVHEWERLAFEQARARLLAEGWPVEDLRFDVERLSQGLAFDLELGNLIKATRFGYVIRAHHGTRPLAYDELRAAYGGVFVDLAEPRYDFMNTLFSLSQASLYTQLVDLLERRALPGVLGYDELFHAVTAALDATHAPGGLKAEIATRPDDFVEPDPDMVTTLLDQRAAGKKLLLITNSEWAYTNQMMRHATGGALPEAMAWRDLFDVVIVSAAKPDFFSGRRPVYRLVDEDRGFLEPHLGELAAGQVYVGGDATLVERSLGVTGDEVLYVGDHLFGDVHVSKAMLRWRTALILRELENEIRSFEDFRPRLVELETKMARKQQLEDRLASLRLSRLRGRGTYAAAPSVVIEGGEVSPGKLDAEIGAVNRELSELDESIAPLARGAGDLGNAIWGPLMRAGSDKSLFARQVERHADVYTSRVSNFLTVTPYAYLRASRTTLPHDDGAAGAFS